MINKNISLLTVLALLTFSCGPQHKHDDHAHKNGDAHKHESKVPHEMPDSATIAANYAKFMSPGEAHAEMAKNDGRWNAVITLWEAPDSEPMQSSGVMEFTMIMNGLIQEGNYTGKMMGETFTGQSITGYDNLQEKVFSTWIDSMSSGIMFLSGTHDAETGKTIMTGKMTDPATGRTLNIKEVSWRVGANQHEMEMYFINDDGTSFKNMHIVYTRAEG